MWFSLFHEAGHILLNHRKREIFINDGEQATAREEEMQANQFARDFLIPPKDYQRFLAGVPNGRFSAQSVERFAEDIGIAPGIVVGRLQHDGLIEHSHLNALKVSLTWTD